MSSFKMTRGELNNNPTNIRVSNTDWQGLRKQQTDKAFCQFVSPVMGLRAALINLRTHAQRLGSKATVANLCAAWAPPNENNTAQYIKAVCEKGGLFMTLSPDTLIASPAQFICLCRGIVYAENGRIVYPVTDFIDAWNKIDTAEHISPSTQGRLW